MGDRWVSVRDGAREATLKSSDAGVRDIAGRWEQLVGVPVPRSDARPRPPGRADVAAQDRSRRAPRSSLSGRWSIKASLFRRRSACPDAAGIDRPRGGPPRASIPNLDRRGRAQGWPTEHADQLDAPPTFEREGRRPDRGALPEPEGADVEHLEGRTSQGRAPLVCGGSKTRSNVVPDHDAQGLGYEAGPPGGLLRPRIRNTRLPISTARSCKGCALGRPRHQSSPPPPPPHRLHHRSHRRSVVEIEISARQSSPRDSSKV